LNLTEGTQYIHQACLDVVNRRTPQPEALYLDSERNLQLVIERKSISWPVDYAHKHANDHFVSDLFSEHLKGLATGGLYELRLPLLIDGSQSELRLFAREASQKIRSHWQQVASSKPLKGRINEKSCWVFRKVPEWDREDDAPNEGLQFTFLGHLVSSIDYIDPTRLPEELVSDLQKIYSRCVKKFMPYSNARRVLSLDSHGDLRDQDADWWRKVLSVYPPPVEIEEVWSGIFDWNDEGLQGWIFERLG
jgi:hypothetical protein